MNLETGDGSMVHASMVDNDSGVGEAASIITKIQRKDSAYQLFIAEMMLIFAKCLCYHRFGRNRIEHYAICR